MNQHVELLVTLGFLGVLMWGMMKFMLRDIHKDLTSIRCEISEIKSAQIRSEERIDNLYNICIEMLKEMR